MLLSFSLPLNNIIYKEPRKKGNDVTTLHSLIPGSYIIYKNPSLDVVLKRFLQDQAWSVEGREMILGGLSPPHK